MSSPVTLPTREEITRLRIARLRRKVVAGTKYNDHDQCGLTVREAFDVLDKLEAVIEAARIVVAGSLNPQRQFHPAQRTIDADIGDLEDLRDALDALEAKK